MGQLQWMGKRDKYQLTSSTELLELYFFRDPQRDLVQVGLHRGLISGRQ